MNATGGAATVAKKWASKAKAPAKGAKPTMITIRCSEAWRAWLGELADADRSATIADVIDRAAVAYARQIGFEKPAPKR